ncbi:MAG: hypothetical protein KTR20_08270 [Cellvibrionaceae bacterium]|nr:hypothetical protein [Cellvibrionaceae bacterium]
MMKKQSSLFCSALWLVSAQLLHSPFVLAEPGVLEDLPLNLGTKVQPNILMLMDDSGSMANEVLISDEAQTAYSVGPDGQRGVLSFIPSTNGYLSELCEAVNVLAYNPNFIYRPWVGVDTSGNPYPDLTLTNARSNPYHAYWSVDISHHFYLVHDDSNNNGEFDLNECGPDFSSYDGATYSGSGGYTPYVMGTDTSSTDGVGYLVDSGGLYNNYDHNESYGFVINPAGATDLTLTFTFVDLANSQDDIRIYQGVDNTGTLLAHFDYPASVPWPITIDSGAIAVYVEMETNDRENALGFVMSWNHSGSGVANPEIIGGVDGVIDPEECATSSYCVPIAEQTTPVVIDGQIIDPQVNYANWYSYYRKRDYVAKKALSDIIQTSTARVGLATLHNNDSVGTQIQDIDDITPVDSTDAAAVTAFAQAAANKDSLLRQLFRVRSNGRTPLREKLYQAGRYFDAGDRPGRSLFGSRVYHDPDQHVTARTPILNNDYGGACQQNFTILFSDGYWNGTAPGIGNTDIDGDGDYDGGTFADDYSDTLADVAMHYYEMDLATSLSDDLNVTDPHHANTLDPDRQDMKTQHQHMTTYTVAFGLNGTVTESPPCVYTVPGLPCTTEWPEPITDMSTTVDDMRHAAWNGRGEFLNARDAGELIDSLNTAIEDIEERTGTASSAAFNAASVGSETLIFRSVYSTGDWSGDIQAYAVDADGTIDTSAAIWSASAQLDAQLAAGGYASRNIITYNGEGGLPFAFPDNYHTLLTDSDDTLINTLSDAQLDDLLANAPYSTSTSNPTEIAANQAFGERVANFIRGDGSGSGLRSRGSYLGAFVHSAPVFVGPPDEPYPNAIESSLYPYRDFVADNANRTSLIFVGGNDGMLHAFNASAGAGGGEEVFAYVPSADLLENNLHVLSELDYFYQAYVDGSIVTADIFVDNRWRTYLVGAMRSGGKGIYVLDITDPAALANASNSLANADRIAVGEFTHEDLGFTYGQPQIAKMNNGRWAAIFGNGYNNTGDGTAKLFILFLDSLTDNSPGAEYVTLETNVGEVANNDCLDAGSDCNGMSSPTLVDLDSDAIVDRIYAGDLHGNMWAFDVSSALSSSWATVYGTQASPEPLFSPCASTQRRCDVSNRQAITASPAVRRHPYRRGSSTSPNVLVYFGTGQYVAVDDSSDTGLQSFYAVWDAGSGYGNLDRRDLTAQTITTSLVGDLRTLSQNSVTYDTGNDAFGWYIDLREGAAGTLEGERVVSRPLLVGDLVFFAAIDPSTGICTGGGSSFIMVADATTGALPDMVVFDLDSDGSFNDAIVAGIASDQIIIDLDVLGGDSDGDHLVSSTEGTAESDRINHSPARSAGRKAWSIFH